jgi:hypothetical protein
MLALAGAAPCLAQSFSYNYDTYYTYAYVDSTHSAQVVTVEGTTYGSCYLNNGTYTIPNCPSNHVPQVLNKIGSTGTTHYGPGVNMFSYMSYNDSLTFVDNPGVDNTSTIEVQIYCAAAAATFLDIFLNHHYLEAQTLLKYTGSYSNCFVSDGVTNCDYNVVPNCTAATSPPTYHPPVVQDAPPPFAGWWATGLCVRIRSTDPWECGQLKHKALKTTETTPGVCTKA